MTESKQAQEEIVERAAAAWEILVELETLSAKMKKLVEDRPLQGTK